MAMHAVCSFSGSSTAWDGSSACGQVHALALCFAPCRYLNYVMRERKFDDTTVEDLIVLKDKMALNNAEVAAALYERALRTEKKYGNLMLSTSGVLRHGNMVCCNLQCTTFL